MIGSAIRVSQVHIGIAAGLRQLHHDIYKKPATVTTVVSLIMMTHVGSFG